MRKILLAATALAALFAASFLLADDQFSVDVAQF